jgi:hypothetical protein
MAQKESSAKKALSDLVMDLFQEGKGSMLCPSSLRFYGLLQPWFDKTWGPGEIELVR